MTQLTHMLETKYAVLLALLNLTQKLRKSHFSIEEISKKSQLDYSPEYIKRFVEILIREKLVEDNGSLFRSGDKFILTEIGLERAESQKALSNSALNQTNLLVDIILYSFIEFCREKKQRSSFADFLKNTLSDEVVIKINQAILPSLIALQYIEKNRDGTHTVTKVGIERVAGRIFLKERL